VVGCCVPQREQNLWLPGVIRGDWWFIFNPLVGFCPFGFKLFISHKSNIKPVGITL
jgi:hypothetical protein